MKFSFFFERIFGLALEGGIALAVLAGCEPAEHQVSLLAYNSEKDDYGLRVVELETIEDIDRLDGSATVLRGSASVELDYISGLLEWQQSPRSVAFDWFDSDGVIIPADYDSLAMVSIYHNIERSALFFSDIGFDIGILAKMPTYYWPQFDITDEKGQKRQKDNAFYMYISERERGFFILPFEQMQWIPMALNTGIITHEYSHAVFDVLIWDPNRMLQLEMAPHASNFIYALNEGWADFAAVARTGDPDFIDHSIPKGVFLDFRGSDVVRDASVPADYTKTIDAEARQLPQRSFDPYAIGSFVSSLMYSFSNRIDSSDNIDKKGPTREARLRVAAWFLQSLEALGKDLTTDFELQDFFSLFVTRIDNDTAKADFCEILLDRYALHYEEVRGCP